ncbi:hypothetical protein CDAR_460041 [Caerostris darwini]|uniref:Uncharacterized protein n=1 Tax=Caerostris darwini TaxID=1538125 RepID=A0AAV4QLY4_9ARAC|nr:hypothetical protein CDAR_460041 [Caerostris darwini]
MHKSRYRRSNYSKQIQLQLNTSPSPALQLFAIRLPPKSRFCLGIRNTTSNTSCERNSTMKNHRPHCSTNHISEISELEAMSISRGVIPEYLSVHSRRALFPVSSTLPSNYHYLKIEFSGNDQ